MTLSRRGFIGGALAAAGVPAATSAADAPTDYRHGALGKIVGALPPGRYDCHTHVYPGKPDPARLVADFRAAGLAGGVAFSRCPNGWQTPGVPVIAPEQAMDEVIEWCSGSETIYPFYWIDPVAPNACELVDLAVKKGIYGFKVIRSAGRPVDEVSIKTYRKIAAANRPVTFHSGILWDGHDSSEYFRPANWEGLLEAPGLRFALAHISWPWCDECIAVYGKLLNAMAMRGSAVPEMFVDTTPGTPKIYRRDAMTKLFTVGYDVADHVMYGTDCCVNRYETGWAADWQRVDDEILRDAGLGPAQLDSVYRGGLVRYLFGGDNSARKVPTPDGTDGNPNAK